MAGSVLQVTQSIFAREAWQVIIGGGGGRTGQPTAMAGDTFRVIMDMGKFQGVIAATTPTGCLITTGRLPLETVCSTSPFTLLHSSANHSMDATLYSHTHLVCNVRLQWRSVQSQCWLVSQGGVHRGNTKQTNPHDAHAMTCREMLSPLGPSPVPFAAKSICPVSSKSTPPVSISPCLKDRPDPASLLEKAEMPPGSILGSQATTGLVMPCVLQTRMYTRLYND